MRDPLRRLRPRVHAFHVRDELRATIDEYAAYRLSDLYERDRQSPDARSEAGQRWRAFEEDQDGRWEIVRLWRQAVAACVAGLPPELPDGASRSGINPRP